MTRPPPRGRQGEAVRATGTDIPAPIGRSSGLPLFPGAPGPAALTVPSRSTTRPPLGVRRPTPAMPRSPVRKARPESAEQLAFTASAGARTRTQAVEATATVSLRLMAGALDAALLILVDVVVIGLTLRLAGLDVASMGVLPAPPLVAFLLLLDVGYVVVLTSTGGQTFGKMAVGIRTVDAAGHPVPMSAALMRATVIVLSLLPAGAGLVWLCVARDRRGLHDRVAGTRVVLV